MATSYLKKPTKLVRAFIALDPVLRNEILAAAHAAINLRAGITAGRVYIMGYYRCCSRINSFSRPRRRQHIDHTKTVTHVAHQFGLEAYEKTVRTAIRLLDNGHPINDTIAQYQAFFAREAISSKMK